MKMRFILALCAIMIAGIAVAADKAEIKTQKDKNNYSVGYDIGRSMKRQPIDFDVDMMVQGIRDGLAGTKPALSEEEMKEALMAVRTDIIAKLPEWNKKQGQTFLAKNKKEKGVKTTKSGLQYRVITEGKGKKPSADSTVTVNYQGTLIDGTEFDSSYKRGQPATFPVKGVIKGWTEALQMMKEGAKWELFIPSDLAYGERGQGGMIGPNSVLVFEVELISVGAPSAKPGHP